MTAPDQPAPAQHARPPSVDRLLSDPAAAAATGTYGRAALTDAIVQIAAIRYARLRCCRMTGTSTTSGGIGKNELSQNDTTARLRTAWR